MHFLPGVAAQFPLLLSPRHHHHCTGREKMKKKKGKEERWKQKRKKRAKEGKKGWPIKGQQVKRSKLTTGCKEQIRGC
jgi:hypothetical protein